jgi:hypothetical protein
MYSYIPSVVGERVRTELILKRMRVECDLSKRETMWRVTTLHANVRSSMPGIMSRMQHSVLSTIKAGNNTTVTFCHIYFLKSARIPHT